MLSSERRRLIHEESLLKGEVSIPALAKRFGVSVETVRRDINILSEQNVLTKVHGGAVPKRPPVREDAYAIRSSRRLPEKNAIAQYIAANLIQDHDRIALASGSTAEIIAQKITGSQITVVTNSIAAAAILQEKLQHRELTGEVILLGGTLSPDERYTGGIFALQMLEKFTFSKAILCASAVDGTDMMTANPDEGIVMSAMIRRAKYCCLAADSGKIGIRSTYTYADLNELDTLITDNASSLSEDALPCRIIRVETNV